MSDAYKNTRTSHTATDSAVLGHAGHTYPGGPKAPISQKCQNQCVDRHPETNECLHRGHWDGNTLLPNNPDMTSYENNQENLTRGGLQVGKPVIGLSTTPPTTTSSLGTTQPTTGLQHGLQMPGQTSLPTDARYAGTGAGVAGGNQLGGNQLGGSGSQLGTQGQFSGGTQFAPPNTVAGNAELGGNTYAGTPSGHLNNDLNTRSGLGTGSGLTNTGFGGTGGTCGTCEPSLNSNLNSNLRTGTLNDSRTTTYGTSDISTESTLKPSIVSNLESGSGFSGNRTCGHGYGACPSDCVSYRTTTTTTGTSIPLKQGGLSGSLADPGFDKNRLSGDRVDSVKTAIREQRSYETPSDRRL